MNTIPTKINKYNVYNAGNRLLGMGDEMSLPDFEPSSETVSGAGILGEIDDPTVGYFGNQELEIPFRVLDREAMDMMDMTKASSLRSGAPSRPPTARGILNSAPCVWWSVAGAASSPPVRSRRAALWTPRRP